MAPPSAAGFGTVSHNLGYSVVSVAGEVDAGTERVFRDALTSVLARGVPLDQAAASQ